MTAIIWNFYPVFYNRKIYTASKVRSVWLFSQWRADGEKYRHSWCIRLGPSWYFADFDPEVDSGKRQLYVQIETDYFRKGVFHA